MQFDCGRFLQHCSTSLPNCRKSLLWRSRISLHVFVLAVICQFGCSAWTQWPCYSSGSRMPTSHPDAWVQSLGSPCGICGGKSGSRPHLSFSTSVFSLPINISPLLDVHLITAREGCGTYIHDHVLCKRHRKIYLNNQGWTKPPIFSFLTSQTSRLMSGKTCEFINIFLHSPFFSLIPPQMLGSRLYFVYNISDSILHALYVTLQ